MDSPEIFLRVGGNLGYYHCTRDAAGHRLRRHLGFILAVLFVACSAVRAEPNVRDAAELRKVQTIVQELLPKLRAVTVGIAVADDRETAERESGQGSGVIVSREGLILTAGHVSGKPGRDVSVMLPDGRVFKGKTLGRNGVEDCGMIQIEFKDDDKDRDLPFAAVGKSSSLRAGDWVMALGHPGGYRADRPAVLRVGRVIRQGLFIQTDAVLVGGDSGGPLFDLSGNVVGIHSRIGNATHDNRHTPIDKFSASWNRLAAGEDWNSDNNREAFIRNQAYLGVESEQVTEGARVVRVVDNSPAAPAGILAGDVIVQFNGKAVEDPGNLRTLIGTCKAGDTVELTLLRDGETMNVSVKLARNPQFRG